MGGEEKPPPTPSPPNQGRDPCLWVMGRGAVGIRDLWGQLAPRCHPGTGCLHAPLHGQRCESWEGVRGGNKDLQNLEQLHDGEPVEADRTGVHGMVEGYGDDAQTVGGGWEHSGSNLVVPNDSHRQAGSLQV